MHDELLDKKVFGYSSGELLELSPSTISLLTSSQTPGITSIIRHQLNGSNLAEHKLSWTLHHHSTSRNSLHGDGLNHKKHFERTIRFALDLGVTWVKLRGPFTIVFQAMLSFTHQPRDPKRMLGLCKAMSPHDDSHIFNCTNHSGSRESVDQTKARNHITFFTTTNTNTPTKPQTMQLYYTSTSTIWNTNFKKYWVYGERRHHDNCVSQHSCCSSNSKHLIKSS